MAILLAGTQRDADPAARPDNFDLVDGQRMRPAGASHELFLFETESLISVTSTLLLKMDVSSRH